MAWPVRGASHHTILLEVKLPFKQTATPQVPITTQYRLREKLPFKQAATPQKAMYTTTLPDFSGGVSGAMSAFLALSAMEVSVLPGLPLH